ncbi:hypothetical protein SAMN04489761_3019 [Tenacibaculum sp. MAR_2009_124]|nr:hypothetical protein SAMN04489761_3019 [Tenacibaculum sp. MAR_2009_124]
MKTKPKNVNEIEVVDCVEITTKKSGPNCSSDHFYESDN